MCVIRIVVLGSPLAGESLDEVIDDIVDLRARLRAEHGWIMDVYALGAVSSPSAAEA